MLVFNIVDQEDAHVEDTATDVVVAATRTMSSSSTSDGELLAQLAATIVSNEMLLEKKKVIDYLVDLTFNLKRKHNEIREVTVVGPRGVPVYAIVHDYLDGYSDEEREVDGNHWNVAFCPHCTRSRGQRRYALPSRTLWRPRFV